jgi:hypothetical protein
VSPADLGAHVGRIRSRMGACFLGSHAVFRGHDLHGELGALEWTALYLLGITGRRFSDAQVLLLQSIWCYTSYPDARLWNNRVVALAGTTRSTGTLALSAGLALSEAGIYGIGPCLAAIRFFVRTRAELAGGADLATCVRRELSLRRGIAGYGRPLVATDERIEPILDLAGRLGLAGGPHLALAHEVDAYLRQQRLRMKMNYAAVVSALAADLGLTPREHYFFILPVFLAGMPPGYLEAAERPAGTLLPLPCRAVTYRGAQRRRWPS